MNKYFIEIDDVSIKRIEYINLIFENCNEIQIFSDEIIDMRVDCCDELVLCGDGIKRGIKSGYIKIVLDKKNHKRRNIVIDFLDNEKANDEKIINRIVGDCELTFMTIVDKIKQHEETLLIPFEFVDEEISIPSVCSTCKLTEDHQLLILLGESSEFVQYEKVARGTNKID